MFTGTFNCHSNITTVSVVMYSIISEKNYTQQTIAKKATKPTLLLHLIPHSQWTKNPLTSASMAMIPRSNDSGVVTGGYRLQLQLALMKITTPRWTC